MKTLYESILDNDDITNKENIAANSVENLKKYTKILDKLDEYLDATMYRARGIMFGNDVGNIYGMSGVRSYTFLSSAKSIGIKTEMKMARRALDEAFKGFKYKQKIVNAATMYMFEDPNVIIHIVPRDTKELPEIKVFVKQSDLVGRHAVEELGKKYMK